MASYGAAEAYGPDRDHAMFAQQVLVNSGLDKEWEVVIADDRTLQVDLDSPTPDYNDFHRVKNILDEHLSLRRGERVVTQYKQTFSKGGNVHIQISLPVEMPATERVAWQAALGSDPVREALNLTSISRGDRNPILLFERKEPKLLTPGEIENVIV